MLSFKPLRVSAAMVALLALGLGSAASAQTATPDYRTFFTFSAPVALPGVTLAPGTYVFRVPAAEGGRRVVQVLSEDGMQFYAHLMTIPALRFEEPASPEVRFMETPEDTPTAIRTWWYPGTATGWEFVYPKQQAMRLSKSSGEPVLTTAGTRDLTTREMETSELTRISPTGAETPVTSEYAPAAGRHEGASHAGTMAPANMRVPAQPVAAHEDS